MNARVEGADQAAQHAVLADLGRKARQAASDRELGFLLVNDTVALAPYRQAALWLDGPGTWCLSGVVQVDANVPYVLWLDAVCRHLQPQPGDPVRPFTANDLPADLAAQWSHWWPAQAVLVGSGPAQGAAGACVLVREDPWQRRVHAAVLLLAVLAFPVRLTVLAPGELVPAQPLAVRAPLDGVIDVFHVQPNQQVQDQQPLFSFDEIVIQSRLDVATQALETTQTDYRQTSQQALADARAKSQLGLLAGKIEEKRAEIEYLQEQLTRARVLAPRAGVVLMDDPSEWIGKPVATGERILRIATLDDVEVEAWVSLADAISLPPGTTVTLYLSASPLSPVAATLRYMSHDAVQRPDGTYAYRVRARLDGKTGHRVGLKGTAKLQGQWIPLSYWVLRRPLASARAYLGW